MRILGLRKLESSGILPVTKPYILFNVKDLYGEAKTYTDNNKKTAPGNGPNPNFCTIMNIKINLPINPIFFPNMTCQVFDESVLGIFGIKRPIGNFTLDLANI